MVVSRDCQLAAVGANVRGLLTLLAHRIASFRRGSSGLPGNRRDPQSPSTSSSIRSLDQITILRIVTIIVGVLHRRSPCQNAVKTGSYQFTPAEEEFDT